MPPDIVPLKEGVLNAAYCGSHRNDYKVTWIFGLSHLWYKGHYGTRQVTGQGLSARMMFKITHNA